MGRCWLDAMPRWNNCMSGILGRESKYSALIGPMISMLPHISMLQRTRGIILGWSGRVQRGPITLWEFIGKLKVEAITNCYQNWRKSMRDVTRSIFVAKTPNLYSPQPITDFTFMILWKSDYCGFCELWK
jgi:hypothetical protein